MKVFKSFGLYSQSQLDNSAKPKAYRTFETAEQAHEAVADGAQIYNEQGHDGPLLKALAHLVKLKEANK